MILNLLVEKLLRLIVGMSSRVKKTKLKNILANVLGRICLTSYVWTVVTTQGYMTVTTHYVDDKWKLNNKLLVFCELESPHTGMK